MRKELTLEGGIGVLPRAETLKRAVFPAGCTLGAEVRAGGAERAGPLHGQGVPAQVFRFGAGGSF